MTEEIVFEEVAPVIPVRNLDAALDRYRRLGFAVRPSEGTERYGFADRGSVTLHLSESAAHDPDRRRGRRLSVRVRRRRLAR